MATNTDPNGGWWFYKWYGDMSGNMVATTPPNATSATALDGFANLDAAARTASVLFGGVNDGTVQIAIKGFQAAGSFGTKVHVVVEHTPFANRTTAVKATDVVSTMDMAIANDQINVSLSGANSTDGYRVVLTAADGGASGTAGAGGRAGSVGTGGAAGAGGMGAVSGAAGRGVAGNGGSATGGSLGAGGTAGSTPVTPTSQTSGCSCRTERPAGAPVWVQAIGALAALMSAGSRRRGRRAVSRQ